MPTTAAPVAGATALSQRALGPDLARGAMLLFIALANSHYFIQAADIRGGYPQDGSTLDRCVVWLLATFVDGRAFPLFGLLFGYGVAQIVRRHEALGRWPVRRMLWRRGLCLVVVGFLHAMLLYVGDILAAYGVLLLVGAWVVWWRDRWLLLWATMFFLLNALPSPDSSSVSTEGPHVSMLPPDLVTALAERVVVQPYIMLLGPIGFACPFLVGLWAGRRRVLERPAEHRRLLGRVAAVGVTVSFLGAQPVALMLAGVTAVPGPDVLELMGPLHDAAGVLGGFHPSGRLPITFPRALRRCRGRSGGSRCGRPYQAGRRAVASASRSIRAKVWRRVTGGTTRRKRPRTNSAMELSDTTFAYANLAVNPDLSGRFRPREHRTKGIEASPTGRRVSRARPPSFSSGWPGLC